MNCLHPFKSLIVYSPLGIFNELVCRDCKKRWRAGDTLLPKPIDSSQMSWWCDTGSRKRPCKHGKHREHSWQESTCWAVEFKKYPYYNIYWDCYVRQPHCHCLEQAGAMGRHETNCPNTSTNVEVWNARYKSN